MAITSLAPGIRFHPTDVELVKFYLKRKVLGKPLPPDVIAEVDVYKNEPWDLPDKSYMLSGDMKWYFLCPLVKKYTSGGRVKRATDRGFWKTTGRDRPVLHNAETVGMIRTLVYHQGRAPKGNRTDWVMHEYRLEEKALADKGIVQDSFVLCTIFQKEGHGPRNGAHYGAPFKEDDWSDNEDEDNGAGNALSETQLLPVPLLPSQSHSVVTTVPVSESMCTASTSGCGQSAGILPSAEKLPTVFEIDGFSTLDLAQIQEDGDYLSMLDLVQEDHSPDFTKNIENELLDDPNQAAAHKDENDLFKNLGDLSNWFGGQSENGARSASDTNTVAEYDMDQIWAAVAAGGQGGGYIQLADFDTPLNGPSG